MLIQAEGTAKGADRSQDRHSKSEGIGAEINIALIGRSCGAYCGAGCRCCLDVSNQANARPSRRHKLSGQPISASTGAINNATHEQPERLAANYDTNELAQSQDAPGTTGNHRDQSDNTSGKQEDGSNQFANNVSQSIPSRSAASCKLLASRKPQQEASRMEAAYLAGPSERPSAGYPNNTLLADLNKCHRQLGRLWPPSARSAAAALVALLGCWPPSARLRAGSRQPTGRAFHMPASIAHASPKLKLDDYDQALSVLNADIRYRLHLLLHRRLSAAWLLITSLLCLIGPLMLLTSIEPTLLAGACLVWFGLQLVGAFATSRLRKKLDLMLEKSVAQVNSFFMHHNLMLGVINAGGLLTRRKLLIPMLYFDTSQCRERIESIISLDSRAPKSANILDYPKIDLPLTKPNSAAFAQSQLAKKIVLRYSQRWISYFDKRKLMFTDDRVRPRHLSTGKCLCQFIEEHFRSAPAGEQPQAKENRKQAVALSSHANKPLQGVERPAAASLPTLSRLVSLRDQLVIDMDSARPLQPLKAAIPPPGDLGKTNLSSFGLNLTPSSSPDISLDLSRDSIGRTDELARKLRLLLELRKNELQNGDGPLFLGSQLWMQYPFAQSPFNTVDSQPTLDTDEAGKRLHLRGAGRKGFFSSKEGSFFHGSFVSKRSQQEETGRNQVLEIC